MSKKDSEKSSKIETSAFKRSLKLAGSYARSGTRLFAHTITASLKDKETREAARLHLWIEEAERIVDSLGELKGSVVKIAQMFTLYGERFLPPEIHNVFKKLQSAVPPLSWDQIEEALKRELGEKYFELEWDKTSLGSASLGQVHKAVEKASGKVLAVKIQYPGVSSTVSSDMRMVKKLLGVL